MERWKSLTRNLYFFVILSYVSASSAQSGPATRGSLEHADIPAPSLQGNLLGDPTSQKVLVYLPSGYSSEPGHRYPVLYMIHGFSLGPVLDDWGEVVSGAMDSFVSSNPKQAFIVVIPNGANTVSGSFYLDSAVGGNWDKFITSDVVRYVDEHYRTIAEKRSRAVAGHSMGGFAAMRMAMTHSDLFTAAYAMSPCCLDLQDDFTSSNPAWQQVLKLKSVADIRQAAAQHQFWPTALAAFAIAASPDKHTPLPADLPYQQVGQKLVPDPAVIARWKSVMPLNMIASHEADLKSLSGVGLDYGYEDDFTHIPDTARQFGDKLLLMRIPTVIEAYHGDHNNKVPERVGTRMIPYIADHLSFAP